MRVNTRSLLFLVMAGSTLGGCNSGSRYEHASVHGKVTYNGKPVTFGQVLFVPVEPPKDGLVQPASGSINSDGTYELKSETEGGAILGEHKVLVISVLGDKPDDTPAAAKSADAAPAPAPAPTPSKTSKAVAFKSAVPKKYSDPAGSPLTRKVVPGENTIDIELTD